ncbi:MAG: stage II sporulation protein M [Candidatus Hydrogenedentes bacterium]|nr:stage II sporulation protein M [Candidatus Hydrogenedentota bacterium]
MSESFDATEPGIAPRHRLPLAIVALIAGLLLLAGLALNEAGNAGTQALRSSCIVLGDDTLHDGIPVWAAKVPMAPEWGQFLGGEDLALPEEWLIAIDLTALPDADLLASGRLPQAGAAEVIAGPYTTQSTLDVGGRQFSVSGTLNPSATAFSQCYVLPATGPELLSGETLQEGRLLIEGRDYLRGLADLEPDALEARDIEIILGRAPASGAGRWTAFLGLVGVVAGGALIQVRLLAGVTRRAPRFVREFGQVMHDRRRALYRLHVLLYGIFFAWMFAGLGMDKENFLLSAIVQNLFDGGSYDYIGDAYQSGNVLHAAWATFYNNFIVQTAALTVLTSLAPLMLGIFKTGMSLAMAGFVLAPIWSGGAFVFAFHSITMSLELEAYVIACFGVWVWTVHCYRAVLWITPWRELRDGAIHLVAATGCAAVMLAIAALYEAATLIALAG